MNERKEKSFICGSRWVRFEKGHHEVVIDLQKNTSLQKVLVRTLNYNQEKVISFFREEWKDVAGWAIVRSATG